ncbi:MAG: aminoglycoside phosphotransferase family protein [Clostridiales bacterium]|jgi:hypothetical protein|nr:aminoglycoside phosphotransferase family protein [Clostridiales bacterium]
MAERDNISGERLDKILSEFSFDGEFSGYIPYGNGHINDTFLASFRRGADEMKYIIQRINAAVFKNVPMLMRNFELVTEFLGRRVSESGGDPSRGALTLIFTRTGKSFVEAEGEFFRAFVFIGGATAYQSVEKPAHFFEAGRAFGRFAVLLNDFDASKLYESIPDFHNTEKRFQAFSDALNSDRARRAASADNEIEFTLKRRACAGKIVRALDSKLIPLRVTHNDTKLNNVMIDDETETAAAVIDLDTVMPGSLLYDFGDSIRSGCNTGAEDEKDLNKVNFDLGLFETYADGYIGEAGRLMTKTERELLGFAPFLMTFECGMRFLTDYLDGDNYFKTKRPEHNLDRARTQYKLAADMEKNEGKIKEILDRIFEKHGIGDK